MEETLGLAWFVFSACIIAFLTWRIIKMETKLEKKEQEKEELLNKLALFERAHLYQLGAFEAEDLDDLITHYANKNEDKFSKIWEKASDRVKMAFTNFKAQEKENSKELVEVV